MKRTFFRNIIVFSSLILFVTVFMSVGFSALNKDVSITSTVDAYKINLLVNNGTTYPQRFLNCTSFDGDDVTSLTFSRTAPSAYTQTCDVSAAQDGSIIAYFNDGAVYVVSDNGYVYTSSNTKFENLTHCNSINFNHLINTKYLTNASEMFLNLCSDSSCSMTNLDLTDFDTSSVTNMAMMFKQNLHVHSIDLSSFNTSNVTNMTEMFWGSSGLEIIYANSNKWSTSSMTASNASDALRNLTSLPNTTNCPTSGRESNPKTYLAVGKCLTSK